MNKRLPALTSKKVIKALERASFFRTRVTGSHYCYERNSTNNLTQKVVIPYHTKDLKRPLLKAIIKQAGLSVNEFIDLL